MALWKRKNREQSATVRGERKAAAFLIARYRSGTGALGSLLDRHEATHYCREVLHPDEMPRNLFARIAKVMEATPVIEALWKSLLLRLRSHENLLSRLARHHEHDGFFELRPGSSAP